MDYPKLHSDSEEMIKADSSDKFRFDQEMTTIISINSIPLVQLDNDETFIHLTPSWHVIRFALVLSKPVSRLRREVACYIVSYTVNAQSYLICRREVTNTFTL